jgi:hypothetical protein
MTENKLLGIGDAINWIEHLPGQGIEPDGIEGKVAALAGSLKG